jgi:hypothetical protein
VGDADFSFRKGQVKVLGTPGSIDGGVFPALPRRTRLLTRVHDVKQRADFTAICASCPAPRDVNSSL